MPKLFNTNEFMDRIIRSRAVRRVITRKSHLWFFHVFFAHYISFSTAPFQREIFALTEDDRPGLTAIVAFRESGKSTIVSLSYVLWAILGVQQRKYVLIVSQTQAQAQQHLHNIRRELEQNDLLRSDLGPFQDDTANWGAASLVLPRYGARISAVSVDQAIRGTRHEQHRPDLIICDDVENTDSVRTREGRDKTYRWFTGEVLPVGSVRTRIFVVGNLLHEDSLIMRLRQDIEEGRRDGLFKSYPLIDEHGISLWPGRYSDNAAITTLQRSIGNDIAFQREYLLRILPESDAVIHRDWIRYYKRLPNVDDLLAVMTAVDLAISEKETADYTAIVSAQICVDDEGPIIYILPNPVNERLTFPEQVCRVKEIVRTVNNGYLAPVVVEDVGYQRALQQALNADGMTVISFSPHGKDKRTRLSLTSAAIHGARVLFPRLGAEHLIEQLVGFGVERHDDLADAFAMLVLQTFKDYANASNKPQCWFIETEI